MLSDLDREMESNLIDRIYEAAFVPDMWEGVLGAAASLSGSAGGGLFSFSEGAPPRGRAVEHLKPLLEEFVATGMWAKSDSANRMLEVRPVGFVDVDDYLSAAEIARDPVRISLRKLGMDGGACTVIPMPSGEVVSFLFQRSVAKSSYDTAEIQALDRLRPHLARASLLASRLGFKEAQATVSALATLGLPAAVLAASGRVIAVNALIETMPRLFRFIAGNGMAIAEDEADRLFRDALTAMRGSARPAVSSIPVRARDDRASVVIHLLPLKRSAYEIFSRADILVVVTAISASLLVPSPTILTGLFDLAPAEARLAAAPQLRQDSDGSRAFGRHHRQDGAHLSGADFPQDRHAPAKRARGASEKRRRAGAGRRSVIPVRSRFLRRPGRNCREIPPNKSG